MNRYQEAAKLLALAQKAGARHSSKDNDLIQQMHDRACELGAKCKCEEVMTHPTLRAQVEALILRHPGHANQKTHGNRFGGYGTTKESLRRLKGDKEARERYKTSARKQAENKKKAAQWWDDFMGGKVEAPKPRAVKPKVTRKPSAPKSNFYRKYNTKPDKGINPTASDRTASASLDSSGGGMGAADAMTRRLKK